jgi:hypothetical protein
MEMDEIIFTLKEIVRELNPDALFVQSMEENLLNSFQIMKNQGLEAYLPILSMSLLNFLRVLGWI